MIKRLEITLVVSSNIVQSAGINFDIVKKIDKDFLEHGTREEFKQAILELLDLIPALMNRVEELEAEVLRLKGENSGARPEKLSSSFTRQRLSRFIPTAFRMIQFLKPRAKSSSKIFVFNLTIQSFL